MPGKKHGNTGILSGIRIVEWSEHRAAALAGMLLAEQGADVVSISNSDAKQTNPGSAHIFNHKKNIFKINNQSTEDLNEISKLIGSADIFLEDLGTYALTQIGISYHQSSAFKNPGLITCSLPGYPESDPRSRVNWTEQEVCIEAGVYEHLTGLGKPEYFPLPLASTYTAFHAINAIVMALITRHRTGRGQQIEIPLLSAAQTLQTVKFLIQSKPPTCWSTYQMFASPFMGIWGTVDNAYIYLHIGIPRHLRNFLLLLGKIGFISEKAELEKNIDKKTRIDPTMVSSLWKTIKIIHILRKLFLNKDALYWEKTLSNEGLCCIKIRTVSEWIFSPQALESGDIELVTNQKEGEKITIGPPLNFQKGNYRPTSSSNVMLSKTEIINKWQKRQNQNKKTVTLARPMEKVRVLDISRIIAGPFAGRLFAEYGAEVLHVTFRQKHICWEEPFHIAMSGGKDSIAADVSSPQGKMAFQKIILGFKPDIIIHNFSISFLRKYGLDPCSIAKINPNIINISISAYNSKGPWKDRKGFEWNIQSACGLITTFTKNGKPKTYNIPIVDMSTGLFACFGGALVYYNVLQGKKANNVVTHLSMPSYYFLLEYLNSSNGLLNDITRFYKARDDWFLLVINMQYLHKITSITELQFLFGLKDERYENSIKKKFRKRTVAEWKEICKMIKCDKYIKIIKRKKVKIILKDELKRATPLFSFKNHTGLGKVLVSNSPVLMSETPVKKIPPAHLIGADTFNYYKKYGIPVESWHNKMMKNRGYKKDSVFSRILWFIGQLKWIIAILYK